MNNELVYKKGLINLNVKKDFQRNIDLERSPKVI